MHRANPSWGALRIHGELLKLGFAVVPTVTFRLLHVFVVLSLERRKLLHVHVTAHPTAAWTAHQMVEALPEETRFRYLIRDRDGIYGAQFRRRVAGLGLREVPIAPR